MRGATTVTSGPYASARRMDSVSRTTAAVKYWYFDIQVPARGTDCVADQRAHLPYRLAAAVARRRIRDADPHVAHVDARVGRPRIVVVRPLEVPVRADRDRASACMQPARAGLLADRGGRIAVEHRLHVAERPVRHPVLVVSARVVGRVRGRVPACAREVESATNARRSSIATSFW